MRSPLLRVLIFLPYLLTLPKRNSGLTCPAKCDDTDFPAQYPDLLFSTSADLAPPQYLDVYYKRCNLEMYQKTCYKRAWDCADKNTFLPGAKYFHHFITVSRMGQPPEWHQAVCDAWPYSLFECRKHPAKGIPVCLCLNTKLTQFKVDKYEYNNGTMVVCRVADGHKCSSKSTPLKCADKHGCISQICKSGRILSTFFLLFFSSIFSFIF